MVSVLVVDAKLVFLVESAGVSRLVVVHGINNMPCSAHACGSVIGAIEDTSAVHCGAHGARVGV